MTISDVRATITRLTPLHQLPLPLLALIPVLLELFLRQAFIPRCLFVVAQTQAGELGQRAAPALEARRRLLRGA